VLKKAETTTVGVESLVPVSLSLVSSEPGRVTVDPPEFDSTRCGMAKARCRSGFRRWASVDRWNRKCVGGAKPANFAGRSRRV